MLPLNSLRRPAPDTTTRTFKRECQLYSMPSALLHSHRRRENQAHEGSAGVTPVVPGGFRPRKPVPSMPVSSQSLDRLIEPVSGQSAQQLGIEVGGFLRHHFSSQGDVPHLLHRAGIHHKCQIRVALPDVQDCLGGLAHIRKILLVAGAAGGMSATFASPVAAVMRRNIEDAFNRKFQRDMPGEARRYLHLAEQVIRSSEQDLRSDTSREGLRS